MDWTPPDWASCRTHVCTGHHKQGKITMAQKVLPFKFEFRTEAKRWIATAAIAGLLVLAGCGDGDGDTASANNGSSVIQDNNSRVEPPENARMPAGFNVHKGVRLADGLIPELSGIPLPEGPAVFEVGVAHNADQDPRETAIQTVHFTISPQELLSFYVKSLHTAGFIIKSSVDAFAEASRAHIEFTDADGIPGRLFFSTGAWSESQMGINLYRSSTAH